MDSHETHLTGDDEIIVTKTIRSVSGTTLGLQIFLGVLFGKIRLYIRMVIISVCYF